MGIANFHFWYQDMLKNLEEIKTITKQKDNYEAAGIVQITERAKYLFFGLTKQLVIIGNDIISTNDLREPLNPADIFISLAEHGIIMQSVVPGVKKAVLAMPRLSGFGYREFFELVSECLADLHKCLDSFAVYYDTKWRNFPAKNSDYKF